MEIIFFYIFATLSVCSAIAVISCRSTLSAAMFLVVTLFSIACLFGLIGAHFLAAMQVLVYAGAIMVLFIFVIMLLNLGREEKTPIKLKFAGLLGIAVGTSLATILSLRLAHLPTIVTDNSVLPADYGTLHSIGELLFSNYLIPFELTSVLLLVAIIAAVSLARPHTSKSEKTPC